MLKENNKCFIIFYKHRITNTNYSLPPCYLSHFALIFSVIQRLLLSLKIGTCTPCVCVCGCVWVCVCACVCALANFLTAMNYEGNINACRKTANDKGITWSNDGVELDAKTSITTSSIFPLTPNEQTPSIAEKLTLFRRATVIQLCMLNSDRLNQLLFCIDSVFLFPNSNIEEIKFMHTFKHSLQLIIHYVLDALRLSASNRVHTLITSLLSSILSSKNNGPFVQQL